MSAPCLFDNDYGDDEKAVREEAKRNAARELLPCPFCGSEKIPRIASAIELNPDDDSRSGMDLCVVCDARKGGCGASSSYESSWEDAATAWNKRTMPPISRTTENEIMNTPSTADYIHRITAENAELKARVGTLLESERTIHGMTCIHHMDAERAAIMCPVCAKKESGAAFAVITLERDQLRQQLAEAREGLVSGQCVEMGDIETGGEITPGILIEIPRDQLAAMKESPLYRNVTVTLNPPTDEK